MTPGCLVDNLVNLLGRVLKVLTMATKETFLLCIMIVLLSSSTSWACFQTHCLSRRSFKRSSSLLHEKSQKSPSKNEMLALERDVMESTKARLDLKRINDAFLEEDNQQGPIDAAAWKVALAAGLASAFAANMLLLHNLILSFIVCVAVFVVANGDPLEEDSIAGALARVVGRFTLTSVQPKVQAMARAAVRGNNDNQDKQLQERILELEEENAQLLLWKRRRQAVDEKLADFNVEELKEKARANKITIGGTKSQLLMRLVEAGVVKL